MYCFCSCVGALLSNSWGTALLADPDMFGFMVIVRLPDGVLPVNKSDSQRSQVSEKPSLTVNHAAKMQDILHYDFKVEVCSACMHRLTTTIIILKCFCEHGVTIGYWHALHV